MVTAADIQGSHDRLQDAFEGRYGDFPIEEGSTKVGMLTYDRKRIYVTYRGSVNSLFEIFSCLFFWRKDGVHAGMYHSFEKIAPSFQEALRNCLAKSQIPPDRVEFIVDGYSRGSGLAALTALFLKRIYPQNPIEVLTYSTMNIFNAERAANYEALLGNHHWSFLCKEDLFPRWIGPSCLGFCPAAKPIYFSAKNSIRYLQRVEKQQYTYLMQIPFITWLIKKIIPAALWEAHMPQTYRELARIG